MQRENHSIYIYIYIFFIGNEKILRKKANLSTLGMYYGGKKQEPKLQ